MAIERIPILSKTVSELAPGDIIILCTESLSNAEDDDNHTIKGKAQYFRIIFPAYNSRGVFAQELHTEKNMYLDLEDIPFAYLGRSATFKERLLSLNFKPYRLAYKNA